MKLHATLSTNKRDWYLTTILDDGTYLCTAPYSGAKYYKKFVKDANSNPKLSMQLTIPGEGFIIAWVITEKP